MDMSHEIGISGNLESVYKAITTVEGLKGWWTENTEKEGETFRFGFNKGQYWFKFKILNNEENKSGEWECIEADEFTKDDWVGTFIKFELKEGKDQGSVIVKFDHKGWKDDSQGYARCNSTWGHLMFSLKDYVEKGKGQPMQ